MAEERGVEEGWPSWVWWAGGIFLLLAYCNYSGRDERLAPPRALVGMSARQVDHYRDCMNNSRGFNLSEYAKSEMCRRSALGLDSLVK